MNNTKLSQKFAGGGTTGRGSSMFIDGDTIYSYGYHFPIARRTDKKYHAIPVALFNGNGYSNTTAKHKGNVYSALSGYHFIVTVDLSSNDPAIWKKGLQRQIETATAKMGRARLEHTRAAWKDQLFNLNRQLAIITELFI